MEDQSRMTRPRTERPRHEPGGFTRARAEAAAAMSVERTRAARTVAGNARDDDDRDALLAMLGLAGPVPRPRAADDGYADGYVLTHSLGRYVGAVADLVGVPPDGTACEVTDTVTAYLALAHRRPDHPGRDLMLIWNERQGWALGVETPPSEAPIVLARLGGDMVPAPREVAVFVTEALTRPGATRTLVALPAAVDRAGLAEAMERCTRS
jgi:hypothetical protein